MNFLVNGPPQSFSIHGVPHLVVPHVELKEDIPDNRVGDLPEAHGRVSRARREAHKVVIEGEGSPALGASTPLRALGRRH